MPTRGGDRSRPPRDRGSRGRSESAPRGTRAGRAGSLRRGVPRRRLAAQGRDASPAERAGPGEASDEQPADWRARLDLPTDRVWRRTALLLCVYLVVFAAIGHRLITVQVVRADEYAALGEQQRHRTVELAPTRGRIYDRNGDILATSIDAATIYADPRAYRPPDGPEDLVVLPPADPAETARVLAPLLERDASWVEERLRRDAHFVYLARLLPYEVGEEILELGLPGVGVVTEPMRVYPAGSLAAQILGFTGVDGDGLSGLENQFETVLRGTPGRLNLERAPGGITISSGQRQVIPPEEGTDLVLTVDRELQHVAERAAAEAVEEHDAEAASVVVLDVGSGDILAMASVPGFDPNVVSEREGDARRNRAVTDIFEPGSIQKAVTVAAALEEGLITPETVFTVGSAMTVSGKTFTDAVRGPTQPLTVRQIIERSSNIGSIVIAQQLGPEKLADWLGRFGYGAPLGLGFPGETGGSYPPVEQWSGTSLPTIAIGHGVAIPLMQAAYVYATLANDGIAVQPRLVRGTVGGDGRLVPSSAPAEHRIVSEETAAQMREMLADAVNGERATGRRAQVEGHRVAGKTGTARKPLEGARGYSNDYIGSFVGFAPIEEPEVVIATMVDAPGGAYYGGVVAAPVFSEVMSFALSNRRVPPSEPLDEPGEGEAPSG
jgi:cell division protein FtsI (penicillin-binding protein 3)